jgi:hypothetical protein
MRSRTRWFWLSYSYVHQILQARIAEVSEVANEIKLITEVVSEVLAR